MPFDPELIWQHSQLDFSTTAGFLHENCLHFLEDAAIGDAALESEYFSDAGTFLYSTICIEDPVSHCAFTAKFSLDFLACVTPAVMCPTNPWLRRLHEQPRLCVRPERDVLGR